MDLALEAARSCRLITSPNPWVGCVIDTGENQFLGATSPPGGNHAEVSALEAAGPRAQGADLYTTLEPCDHQGPHRAVYRCHCRRGDCPGGGGRRGSRP